MPYYVVEVRDRDDTHRLGYFGELVPNEAHGSLVELGLRLVNLAADAEMFPNQTAAQVAAMNLEAHFPDRSFHVQYVAT